jgi:hypothetical protein
LWVLEKVENTVPAVMVFLAKRIERWKEKERFARILFEKAARYSELLKMYQTLVPATCQKLCNAYGPGVDQSVTV